MDKLYGWTPLVHAASEGNVPCLKVLLEVGVDPNILDEKHLPALYYAAWEGHLECMKLLSPFNRTKAPSPLVRPIPATPLSLLGSSSAPIPMALDPDAIPVLELPPPIIPLRRYGHNFLDTKTVVQINFGEGGQQPLMFFHNSKYPASRLTISSKASDLIPKNIILPFQEDTRLVSFHVDNLDSFTLDFDVFPAYGAKVIAKTVALPSTFRALLSSAGNSCCLPLFDPRLRAIGQISFHTQVIKPFRGVPLEISDFETYWKATSQLDGQPSTIVSGSSLSGDFVRLHVQQTSDGVPVLWPYWTVSCGNGVAVPVARLKYEQFAIAVAASGPAVFNNVNERVSGIARQVASTPPDRISYVHEILATSGVRLQDAFLMLPAGMHVNLQIIYPTAEEDRELGLLGPGADMNTFADDVLSVVFDHARAQRAQAPDAVRSVVFSSYNPSLCTALNWKQPNFPVFLCNDLGQETADGMAPQIGDTDRACGSRTSSIKEAVRTAESNNFMGLICCSRLLVSFFYSIAFGGLHAVHSSNPLSPNFCWSGRPRLYATES